MNSAVRGTLLVLFTTLFLTAAGPASAKKNDILSYIPADTPYVFVSTEPMPDKLADKLEPAMDRTLAAYRRVLKYQFAESLVELSGEEGGAEKAEKLQGFVDEILGLMSVEGIRGAGIARDSGFAFFGNGLLPVLRLELDDVEAFNAAIERIEDRVGEAIPVANISGKSYRYLDNDVVRLIIATLDGHAVITAVPLGVEDGDVAMALGIDKPKKSIAKSRELRDIARRYGLSDYLLGFVNTERVAAAFLGDPTGRNRALLELTGYQSSAITDVCKAEIAAMAAIAPRTVFGYTKLDTRRLDSRVVVEMREDIAKGLMSLPAAVPGLGVDPGGFMSLGFSLDLLALRSFYEARLDAIEEEPYECEFFAQLQAGAAKGREALAQPIPPIVYSFRGFLANITDMDIEFGSDQPPKSIDGSLLVAVENAPSLVTMAAMMDPQVAALNLLPDGKAVALDLPQLAVIAEEAFAALSDNALAVSLGSGAEQDAQSMLKADGVSPPPVVSVSMDAARYYEMVGEAMMQDDDSRTEEPMPLAMREALRDVMLSSGDLYERILFNVRFTQHGIDIDGRVSLAD